MLEVMLNIHLVSLILNRKCDMLLLCLHNSDNILSHLIACYIILIYFNWKIHQMSI